MNLTLPLRAGTFTSLEVLWENGERVLYRGWRDSIDGDRKPVLAVVPAAEQPTPDVFDRLAHEYSLRAELDCAWAAQPIELVHELERIILLLEERGGEPLERLLGAPMEMRNFLSLATKIAAVLGKLHQSGLVHKDLKPAHILVNCTDGQVRLTGFGLASRLPRERQTPEPPEFIAGTLAYMAPEQTGRMNRSIDSRSDLYTLGIILYQMLTGGLPFTASDPMEWVHCHVARRPVPPSERMGNVPAQISELVMKLLAKTAEERYQTAAGVESDLRRCLAELELQGRIELFALGERDTPERLMIPERLYGRAREVETLLAAFNRIVESGVPELVLVSGYSGIGKSSVVNELHKALVPSRGLFASGKFDQRKRDIPYSTLVQAFQSLVRPLLSKSDVELASWRDALVEALGPNGRLMVDLVPELRLIIGEQPPVPELPPQDAQRRFQRVFRRFIGVFARPEHPLALFLDDLQWLDSATLDLIEDLLTQPDLQHLMLIGAYRDNEVDVTHPLRRKLQGIKNTSAKIEEITVAPLASEHLGQLIADALRCGLERAAPLAQLVRQKTSGNPYFAIQFVSALAEDGLLTFDHDDARWSWDLNRIHAKGYTDNVAELMIGKLTRLPVKTQKALQQLSCIGNVAEIAILSMILGTSGEQVDAALWEAVHQDLVERQTGYYKFVHDRVQEAAYSLIPEASRASAHLRIGRLLAANTPSEKREEAIFEIVHQLNPGAGLISSRDEREQLAELNLLAGKRAKASTAYASALTYLIAGATVLSEDSWERRHELIFALELHRAECEFLTGALAEAEERLTAVSTRAANTVEQGTVASLRVDLYTTLGQSDRAVTVCLDYLRHLGIEWSPHPTEEEVRREYARIWSQLGSRSIEELVDLPLMSDPTALAIMDVLTKVVTPALFTDANLASLAICQMVNLSLERGNSDGSCCAYVWLGRVAGSDFGAYKAGYRFGRLGCELVEQRDLKRFQARTYVSFAYQVIPWAKHIKAGRDLLRRAFEAANRTGDLTFAAYSRQSLNANLLAAGDPLVDVQHEAATGLEFAQKARFGFVNDIIVGQLGLIRTLLGLTPKFGCFSDEQFDEHLFERRLTSDTRLAGSECKYWIRKLQARYFAGDYDSALLAAGRAQRLLWTSPSFFETAEYHFYGALSHAASWDSASASEKQHHIAALKTHHTRHAMWAENCPDNFETRAALVGAEMARIEGRDADAMRLYEQAIRSARANGFVQNEAIANEAAARFYVARGFEKFARVCLQDARHSYLRWGAFGKVRQLDESYPHLIEEERAQSPTSTIETPVEHLDLGTVIKVSQAVSGEIVLDKLLDTLMRMAIEQAGAERGVLIMLRGAEPRIAAEATTGGDTIVVRLREQPVIAMALPTAIVQTVLRTQDTVILDDAAVQNLFSTDPYLQQRQTRSILCLPLITQGKLIGVLYLENNLAPRVFAPGRITMLKLLASQAAIALENNRLYRDLAEREAKIRRLVDANIVGIFIWDLEGLILDANDAFLRIVGYDREALVAGHLRWTELTPPEWRDSHDQWWTPELKMTGSIQPYEKEYFRKDGSRVSVLLGSTSFTEARNQGVAFVLDLTERKRAEQALRDSEEQWRAVFEHNPTMYFMIDTFGTIVSVNSFGAEQLGYTVDELVGRAAVDIAHEADRSAVGRNAAACFEQLGRPMSWEARKRRKDGSVVWVRETARTMLIKQQPILLVVCEDISEHKRVEHLTQQWFDNAPSAVAIIGRDCRYLRVNRVFERDWGIPTGQVTGMHVAELRGKEEFEQLIKPRLDGCFAGEAQRYSGWWTSYAGRRYAIVTYTPLRPRSEQVEAALVIFSDITDYELAAEALREAQRELARISRVTMLGEITASIAHEIKQPLAGVIANASACRRWLAMQPPNLEKAERSLDLIVRDGSRAGDIIDGIRALVKKSATTRQQLGVNEIIHEVVALTSTELQRHFVVLRLQLGDGLPAVIGDRVQLQQVVLNLILNAIEALRGQRVGSNELTVGSKISESHHVLVSVADSGPGLDPSSADRVFDSFYTTKPDGMGMGLAICRSIIEAHGGRLWVRPNSPRGAIFYFTLPPEGKDEAGDDEAPLDQTLTSSQPMPQP